MILFNQSINKNYRKLHIMVILMDILNCVLDLVVLILYSIYIYTLEEKQNSICLEKNDDDDDKLFFPVFKNKTHHSIYSVQSQANDRYRYT